MSDNNDYPEIQDRFSTRQKEVLRNKDHTYENCVYPGSTPCSLYMTEKDA